jgi:hypothetical protein
MRYPVTPDGRYFVVRGRLWRCANPALDPDERARLTRELMAARRAVRAALRRTGENPAALALARRAVNEAKIALGERGDPWWSDGAPDFNRCMVQRSPYAAWAAALDVPMEVDPAPVSGDTISDPVPQPPT